jgi:hypothetical protein
LGFTHQRPPVAAAQARVDANRHDAEGVRSLAAALDTNRMLQHLNSGRYNINNIKADIEILVGLGVNKLVLKVASWVVSAVATCVGSNKTLSSFRLLSPP